MEQVLPATKKAKNKCGAYGGGGEEKWPPSYTTFNLAASGNRWHSCGEFFCPCTVMTACAVCNLSDSRFPFSEGAAGIFAGNRQLFYAESAAGVSGKSPRKELQTRSNKHGCKVWEREDYRCQCQVQSITPRDVFVPKWPICLQEYMICLKTIRTILISTYFENSCT